MKKSQIKKLKKCALEQLALEYRVKYLGELPLIMPSKEVLTLARGVFQLIEGREPNGFEIETVALPVGFLGGKKPLPKKEGRE